MILTSKGAAGITGAGLVTLTASLQAFGGTFFSAESIAVGIALVVGIDRIMSEGRALTNAIGNSVATLAIARWQGELDMERLQHVLHDPHARRRRGRARDARRRRRRRGRARRPLRPRAKAELDYAVTCSAAPSSAFSARSTDIATHVNVGVSRLV